MSEHQFAKVFHCDTYQVLITKETREENGNEVPLVRIRAVIDGLDTQFDLSFNDYEGRDECFEKYDQKGAIAAFKEIEKMLKG